MILCKNCLIYLLFCSIVAVKTVKIPGATSGTVEIPIGGNASISCTVHPDLLNDERNASYLHFVNLNDNSTVRNAQVFNDTTIVYHIENAPEQQTIYRCLYDRHAIMETKVYVGDKPRPVHNFSCRSYDFEYMICNFTMPKNSLLTQYNLSWSNNNPSYSVYPHCRFQPEQPVVCNVSNYLATEEVYNFKLIAENALGNTAQHFVINNYNVMILTKPVADIETLQLTSEYLHIKWQYYSFYEITHKHKKLVWQALLRPAGMPQQSLNVRESRAKEWQLQVHLPYAYYEYELQLRVRLSSAEDPNNMWSAPFVHTFRSMARLPDRAPNIAIGGFYIGADIHLYWEQLQQHEHNGNNFSYVVTALQLQPSGQSSWLQPLHAVGAKSMATFVYCSSCYYKFEIKSRNHLGVSINSSIMEVYVVKDIEAKLLKPRKIQKAYHLNNDSHTLTWQAPETTAELHNYTVFWCHVLDMECSDDIQFSYVSSDTHEFTISTLMAHQQYAPLKMAVSANYKIPKSAGMQWNECSGNVNSKMLKMKPKLKVLSSTRIAVVWEQTICASVLLGYNISYCELSELDNSCREIPPNTVLAHKDAKSYAISNLKPYTKYQVQMFMFSQRNNGSLSDAQVQRTEEAASTPPRNLQVAQLTNTSVLLTWLPPKEHNGVLRQYVVFVNGSETNKVQALQTQNEQENISFKLQDLLPYTKYDVHVIALTVQRSGPSNHVQFDTLIGFPTLPMNISDMEHNEQTTTISWSEPQHAGGRLEYFEVAIIQLNGSKIQQRHISTVSGTRQCTLRMPEYGQPDYTTIVQVRAINVAKFPEEVSATTPWSGNTNDDDAADYNIKNDLCSDSTQMSDELLQAYHDPYKYRLYKSTWQNAPQKYRYKPASQQSKWLILLLILILTSLLIGVYLLFARQRHKKRSNINCTLPADLSDKFILDEEKMAKQESVTAATAIAASSASDAEYLSGELLPNWSFGLQLAEQHHLLLQANDLMDIAKKNCIKLNDNSSLSNLSVQSTELSVSEENKQRSYIADDEQELTDYRSDYSPNGYATNPVISTNANGYVTATDCFQQNTNPYTNAKQLNGYVTQAALQAFGQ